MVMYTSVLKRILRILKEKLGILKYILIYTSQSESIGLYTRKTSIYYVLNTADKCHRRLYLHTSYGIIGLT